MIDLQKLQSLGLSLESFRLPSLEKTDFGAGKLYLSEAAKAKPPRLTFSKGAELNRVIVCCPVDAPIHIKGSDNLIVIIGDPEKVLKFNLNVWGDDAVFAIGRDTTIGGINVELMQDDVLAIGADCMISKDITIRPNDMHAIFDENDKQINLPAPIVIHDHVWIGQGATILKGNTIGPGSIIGAGSMVTKNVPQASAVAGNPAKTVRERVYWTRNVNPTYSDRLAAKAFIPKALRTA